MSDDLATYKPVVERLDLGHQIYLAHVRKNVALRLKEVEGWEGVKEEFRAIITDLPPDGGQRLLALEREVWAEPKLRGLVVGLCQRWPSLVWQKREPDVPAANNATERAIGRTKIRYKTTRGLKSEEGSLNAFALTQWLFTPKAEHDMAALLLAPSVSKPGSEKEQSPKITHQQWDSHQSLGRSTRVCGLC